MPPRCGAPRASLFDRVSKRFLTIGDDPQYSQPAASQNSGDADADGCVSGGDRRVTHFTAPVAAAAAR
jgi:hypothetical protein